MIPEVSLIGVIGLALSIALYIVKWQLDKSTDIKRSIADEDKRIDAASDASSLVREFNRLRNK